MATAISVARRPHRPGDPLADRRSADEAQIDSSTASDFRPLEDARASELVELIAATGKSRLRSLRRIALSVLLALVVAGIITLQGVELVQRANAFSQPFGMALAVTFAAFILMVSWAIASSIIDYLRVRQHLDAEPIDIAALRRDHGADADSLRKVRASLDAELPRLGAGLDKEELERLSTALRELTSWSRDNTRHWLRHYDSDVLAVIDERVAQRIREEAVIIGLLTSISPRHGLHSLLVLWRQLRLVRSIAMLYGWRPGLAGSFALTRTALLNAALAAGFDELAHFAVQTIPGQAIAVAGGAMAAEALANAALTIRLARQAVNSCRPIRNREAAPYRVGLGKVMAEVGIKVKQAATSSATALAS
jgi:putative membrane protein